MTCITLDFSGIQSLYDLHDYYGHTMAKEMHPVISTIQALFQDLEDEEAEVTLIYSEDDEKDQRGYPV